MLLVGYEERCQGNNGRWLGFLNWKYVIEDGKFIDKHIVQAC